VLQKHSVDITKEQSVLAEIVERLRQQYVPEKALKTSKKSRWNMQNNSKCPKKLSLHLDEDAMEEGVADKLKKRKHDDVDKDEGPSAGSDRGLKRRKTSKDTEPSKKAKSTETSKGTSKGTSKTQPKSTDKSAQAEEIVFVAGDA
ncbi:hypothetical protein Tco_1355628, partial [Tanacetum coccineum]